MIFYDSTFRDWFNFYGISDFAFLIHMVTVFDEFHSVLVHVVFSGLYGQDWSGAARDDDEVHKIHFMMLWTLET